jgi:hypothetical protein
MRPNDLNLRLHCHPFKAFRIDLSDGSTIPVVQTGMVIVGEESAVLPTEMAHDSGGYLFARRWRTVALAHMVQFSDLDEAVSGKGKKRK